MKHHISFDIDFRDNTYPGKFYAIEGIDGSGKTTQAKRVYEALKEKGVKAYLTKEPTDAPTGRMLREALSGKISLPPIALQYLFNADRAVHQVDVERYLKDGYVVIMDRYFWSSVAYGMSDLDVIDDYYFVAFSILSFYNRFLVPNKTFYLKIDPTNSLERIEKDKREKEIYDHMEKLVKIEKGYAFLVEKFPEQFVTINAEKSLKEITETIINSIVQL